MKKLNKNISVVSRPTNDNKLHKNNVVSNHSSNTTLKLLTLMVTSLMAVPVSQADTSSKNIGDLEIYQAATGGKVTITMMLDTSGSMSSMSSWRYGYQACDIPPGDSAASYFSDPATTLPYPRSGCNGTNTTNTYFYRKYKVSKKKFDWYQCGIDTNGTSDYSTTICATKLSAAPSTTGFSDIPGGGGNTYYYKGVSKKYPDRITRLKDAIFYLMDNISTDNNTKVAIGIGQFSTQSNWLNSPLDSPDDVSGKILVPAKLIDATQRQAIKDAVAKLGGSGNTPSAAAYAEVASYMLGTTTKGKRNSGFSNSVNITGGLTSRNSDTYTSPLPSTADAAKCDGQGIYFLTDGQPNNTDNNSVEALMKSALGSEKGGDFSVPSSGGLSQNNVSSSSSGWRAIGQFSKAMRNANQNPYAKSIRTAVVGFGSFFDLSTYSNISVTKQKPVLDTTTSLPVAGKFRTDSDTYIDCSKITDNQDAQNACNWGAKSHPDLSSVGGYGEGGFYSAQSTQDVVDSLLKFLGDLNNDIPSAPSGTISVPKDPYRTMGELPVGYLPTIEAQLSSGNDSKYIWPGNLKKYKIANGTLYGKINKLLFATTTGTTDTPSQAGNLNPSTQDLWQKDNYQITKQDGTTVDANDYAKAGGVYENLKAPTATDGANNVRSVWVEDLTATTGTDTVLRNLSVSAAGVPTGFGALIDTTTYNRANQIKILQFLGFQQGTYTAAGGTSQTVDLTKIPDTVAISNITLVKPTSPTKVLGASPHSKPIAVSYGASLDSTTGRLIDTSRDDYMLYGSMDGVFHMVDADNQGTNDGGKENLAIIPRIMMQTQPDALVPDAKYTISTTRPGGVPSFGIDGAWVLSAKYDYNYTSNKVSPNSTAGIYAYGGMRLGGIGLLGFNFTTKATPTPAFNNSGALNALIDDNTTGFDRISYIFNQPSIARMKTSATDTTGTDVLVFGGGYDMCYENQYFQIGVAANTTNNIDTSCAAKTEADGNAIYIINAKTGELLWSATYDSTATGEVEGKKYMKNSIVGGITVLDRDNDGFIDHLYAADLGGQVFRVDFKDGNVKASATDINITRILKDDQEGTSYAHRFYERPNFSVYRDNTTNHNLFGLVNVVSGDRSSPLSTIRTTDAQADRVYGIVDTDITKTDAQLYPATPATFSATVKDLVVDSTDTNILNLATTMGTIPSGGYTTAVRTTAIEKLSGNATTAPTKKAWYYPLNRFDGHSGVKYTKGVGRSEVINSTLYISAYNPDMVYGSTDPCVATIKGGTEREAYCLPYGICTETYNATNKTGTKTGTGGFERAGQGIQELNFGPVSATDFTTRLMISTLPIANLVNPDNRVGSGSGGFAVSTTTTTNGTTTTTAGMKQTGVNNTDTLGDSSMEKNVIKDRYVATPTIWYEN